MTHRAVANGTGPRPQQLRRTRWPWAAAGATIAVACGLIFASQFTPTAADTDGGLSGEVIAWLAGLGMLLVLWCAAWRLRPGGARIVVRQTDDPRRPPFDAADDPEPVRIEL